MTTTEELLREREKELACIHAICLLAAEAPEPRVAARGIARAMRRAMSHDGRARCVVSFSRTPAVETAPSPDDAIEESDGPPALEAAEARSSTRSSTADARPRMEALLPADESLGWSGGIDVEYSDPALAFLPQERALLESVLVVAASMLRTASLIARLRASTESLGAKNVALREILSMIEDEKRATVAAFRERLSNELLPLAERARDLGLSPERRASYLDLLTAELERGVAALGAGPGSDPSLSPREREIAVQVRNGRTSKEIAELLGISTATVERHRHNIRRKLNAAGRNVNLVTLLGNEDQTVGGSAKPT